MRESTFNFSKHLAEGSPLTGKTKNIPVGLPTYPIPTGQKAYTWEQGAIAALDLKIKGNKVLGIREDVVWSRALNDSSIESFLHKIESYNGFGVRIYQKKPSSYLWADSSVQVPGKYVADGRFDQRHVDTQMGAGTLLKYFLQMQQSEQKKNKLFSVFGSSATDMFGHFFGFFTS
jgi:lysozyme family protein